LFLALLFFISFFATLPLAVSLVLAQTTAFALRALLVDHHVLDRELDNQTLLLTKQRWVVVQPAQTSQGVCVCRVLQETISLGAQLLCVTVDPVLGPHNLGLLDKHTETPALGLLLCRQVSTLSVLDLVLELLDRCHSELAELLLVHLEGQVADRETGLGDVEGWVAGQKCTASREGGLTLGQLTW